MADRQPELLRIDQVFADFSVLQFTDHGIAGDGNLIETVLAMYDHDVAAT